MYVTSGINAFTFTANACCSVAELYSDQKELDTWILLHAKHASCTYSIIVIATPDTDVFMIALPKEAEIEARIFLLAETREKRRLIDMQAVGENKFIKFNKTECTNDNFLNVLLGFHCFTGCDSTSACADHGEIKPLSLMGTCQKHVEAFSDLGASSDALDSTVSDLHIFTCYMYGKKKGRCPFTRDLYQQVKVQYLLSKSCENSSSCSFTLLEHFEAGH